MVKNPYSNAGDSGLIPGRGTKIPHAKEAAQPMPQLERSQSAMMKILCVTTKTSYSQINKYFLKKRKTVLLGAFQGILKWLLDHKNDISRKTDDRQIKLIV